jgi:hypothetical protein
MRKGNIENMMTKAGITEIPGDLTILEPLGAIGEDISFYDCNCRSGVVWCGGLGFVAGEMEDHFHGEEKDHGCGETYCFGFKAESMILNRKQRLLS